MVGIVNLIPFVIPTLEMIYITSLDTGMPSTVSHFQNCMLVDKSVSVYSEITLDRFIMPEAIILKDNGSLRYKMSHSVRFKSIL